jgi:hypothetical protein
MRTGLAWRPVHPGESERLREVGAPIIILITELTRFYHFRLVVSVGQRSSRRATPSPQVFLASASIGSNQARP